MLPFTTAPCKQQQETEQDNTQEAEAAHCCGDQDGGEVQHHPYGVLLRAINQGTVVVGVKQKAAVGVKGSIPDSRAFNSNSDGQSGIARWV